MSPKFAASDIDEVRERADIVEIVGEHVRLKRTGTSWVGLCPFHQEKTPSFSVNRDKGVYFCHGCQKGGSVFTFLEEVEGLSFPEAVESLAQRYGVQLREVSGDRRAPSPRARLIALHEAAVEAYRELLAAKDAEPVRAYLLARGITAEQIEKHAIGYGGPRRDGLSRRMLRRGFTGDELVAGGLANKDGRGLRDAFWGRLLFPIFDVQGRPVGFGGRVLPDAHRPEGAPDGPKYLNSRETAIFKKSRIFYGANWARGDVVRAKRLVVVEGYTDVIALQASGVGETVATCGTSLTEQHMKEISSRFGDVQVVLCLDADAAGQAAMSRERTEELAGAYSPGETVAGSRWLPVGRSWLPEVSVASLPEGKDPADFAEAEGEDGIRRVLDKAVPLIEFLLRRALIGADTATPQGRATAVRRGVGVLAQAGDPLLRHEYALWLADRVGVDSYEVAKAVETAASSTPAQRRDVTRPEQAPVVPLSGHHRVEREALRVLLADPSLFDDDLAPSEDDFTLPVHRSLFRLAASDRATDAGLDVGRLAARLQDDDLQRAVSEIAVDVGAGDAGARETLTRLRRFTLERRIVERKERLRSLDPDREAAAYDALFEELLDLERQRRGLVGVGE